MGTSAVSKLWATEVLNGDATYEQVPAKLKAQVADILRAAGREDLITA